MEIVVPELGESIVEATVAHWLKKEGDPVSVGEPVVELETDKVDLEVGAKEDGVLVKIEHQEGEDVKVGEVLGMIEAGEKPEKPEKKAPPEAKAAEKEQAEAKQQAGQEKQPAAGVQPAPGKERAPAKEREARPPERETSEGNGASAERATPVARRMAQEYGLDLGQIQASGPGERVTKEDVQRYLDTRQAEQAPTPAAPEPAQAPAQAPPRPAPTPASQREGPARVEAAPAAGRGEERVRLSRRRRTIATRLVEAQHTAAMLTTFNDVDMSAVMEIRSRRKASFQEKHGVKLGFMSFFVKASIGALKEFPRVNAELQGDELVLKRYYDIGIAVGAEEGLVVPVLHDADRMTFAEIERKIQEFIEKSQQGTLSLEDLRGGTFTITNGGVFGSLLSTPILNPPQVGILGLHRIEQRPVAVNGQVEIRPMMYMALSYDHRVVDGREAVQFLVRVKELIQDPESLLLEG